MKMWKSKKALSPVVASIILIAVTVAVSIAVAAWMASLTTGQMQTEQLIFTGYSWATPGNTTVTYILISVKNNGASDLSIPLDGVRVDGTATGVTTTIVGGGSFPYALPKGGSVTFNVAITGGFIRGNQYSFTVLTSKGNIFGPYVQTAP